MILFVTVVAAATTTTTCLTCGHNVIDSTWQEGTHPSRGQYKNDEQHHETA